MREGKVDWPPGLVAFWDFVESDPPFVSKVGAEEIALFDGQGSAVTVCDGEGPFGNAVMFDGQVDHLVIPTPRVGMLDVGKHGGQCTVLAWIRRSKLLSTTTGARYDGGCFVAGRWNEDDANPDRQYGLFVDLPTYGGDEQVCGHVSDTGGASPGYAFNRDYSATSRRVGPGEWRLVGFTYDGHQMVSYLDGIAEERDRYADIEGHIYSRNPYEFGGGLNPTSGSDFTVGANRLGGKNPNSAATHGMGLFFAGSIGGLAVFNRALSPSELVGIHLHSLGDEPLARFDFFRQSGWGADLPAEYGWRSARGSAAVPTENDRSACDFLVWNGGGEHFLFRAASGAPENRESASLCYFAPLAGLRVSSVGRISFRMNNSHREDVLRLCVRVDGDWFASATTFRMLTPGHAGTDWSNSRECSLDLEAPDAAWCPVDFVPGNVLSMWEGNQTRLPEGELKAIGFYGHPLATSLSVVRISDVRVQARR